MCAFFFRDWMQACWYISMGEGIYIWINNKSSKEESDRGGICQQSVYTTSGTPPVSRWMVWCIILTYIFDILKSFWDWLSPWSHFYFHSYSTLAGATHHCCTARRVVCITSTWEKHCKGERIILYFPSLYTLLSASPWSNPYSWERLSVLSGWEFILLYSLIVFPLVFCLLCLRSLLFGSCEPWLASPCQGQSLCQPQIQIRRITPLYYKCSKSFIIGEQICLSLYHSIF